MEENTLYIVPTPIGNLGDMTVRAISLLKSADFILAEDTRKTGILLKHYEIDRPMKSYHMHNEHHIVERVVGEIKAGKKLALVTDAGTPGISDPGFLLVRTCLAHGISVQTLPGATAFVPALVNAGLPMDRFVFEGFLPQKKGRQSRIASLQSESRTMVFYESPHRLLKTLGQLAEAFGADRLAAVSRELTKIHEENISGTLESLLSHFGDKPIKGEIVLIVAGQK